jgi:hypothetical protein
MRNGRRGEGQGDACDREKPDRVTLRRCGSVYILEAVDLCQLREERAPHTGEPDRHRPTGDNRGDGA